MQFYNSSISIKRNLSIYDIVVLVSVIAIILLVSKGIENLHMPTKMVLNNLSLDPRYLPGYALDTVIRMLIAMIFSLIVTIIYGTIAAKSKRAEKILIPILDIFQSVPILGVLSFSITFFISLYPNSSFGFELAVIFAAFTNQVANMIFSYYQSLKTIPKELNEACTIFKLSAFNRFVKLEFPFAAQGLIWNSIMSMAGGWFLLVASESVTIGSTTYALPGIGSYIGLAIINHNITAIFYSIFVMILTIYVYDQIIFRPLLVWSDKFRIENNTSAIKPKSILVNIIKKSQLIMYLKLFQTKYLLIDLSINNLLLKIKLKFPKFKPRKIAFKINNTFIDILWYGTCLFLIIYGALECYIFVKQNISNKEIFYVFVLGIYSLVRVLAMVMLAIIIWVPIGVYIGLNTKLAEKITPLIQFAAAFPANLFFPLAVIFISKFNLNPNYWLSFLMLLGTQWYILFNVIAGARDFPNDFKEAVTLYKIRGIKWWTKIILPGIAPFIITGALTATGGAWNASIVAEFVNWGHKKLIAKGLGSYIAIATSNSDYPRIALGMVMMSCFIVIVNRCFWQKIYQYYLNKC